MSVKDAHAISAKQMMAYDSIYSLDFFSIAFNKTTSKNECLKAFHHSHDEYEFLIPLTTIPLLYYHKANYIGEVGYVYPVNPHIEHGLEFDLYSKVISITVDKEYLDKIKEKLGYKDSYFYTKFANKQSLMDLINNYENIFVSQIPNKEKYLIEFSDAIITFLIKNGLKDGIDSRRPEKQYSKNMKNVLFYIEKHYMDQDLTINKLASIAGYSLAYFTRAFKSYMQDTPIMHLNKRRISEAKELLEQTNLSLIEISKKVGYKNLSTFSEAFKRITNLSPRDYKKERKT
ncbi:MAG: helix-turn-helix transcriptional regulator [Bacilli bacterium]|nr:helix-turn-helix transcriptional regulator [Bacilli bacterium]